MVSLIFVNKAYQSWGIRFMNLYNVNSIEYINDVKMLSLVFKTYLINIRTADE